MSISTPIIKKFKKNLSRNEPAEMRVHIDFTHMPRMLREAKIAQRIPAGDLLNMVIYLGIAKSPKRPPCEQRLFCNLITNVSNQRSLDSLYFP